MFARFLNLSSRKRDSTFAVFHTLAKKGLLSRKFEDLQFGFFEKADFLLQTPGGYTEENLSIQVSLLVEEFFSDVNRETKVLPQALMSISDEEITRLSEIESLLGNDLASAPPSISELARKAVMSATRLKQLFREIYGAPVYTYYLTRRMYKARDLLQTGQYTVKQVGIRMGYSNMSHFTAAYKKVFNRLPGNVRKQFATRTKDR
jgi:AraC-like DNA-binding protein